MSPAPTPAPAAPAATPAAPPSTSPLSHSAPQAVSWADGDRQRAFERWLGGLAAAQRLRPDSLRLASADASFRRYLRIDTEDGASRIIMDAPPAHEDCAPFVHVARLMHEAGVHAPEVLDWNQAQGFMLLSDLGSRTMLDVIDPDEAQANRPLYEGALNALIAWQSASRPGQLPPYDEALLRRELALFPDWYLGRHRGLKVQGAMADTLASCFDAIVRRNLAAPSVYVHRDFMPRNLMLAEGPVPRGPGAAAPRLGVLDFQDAVYGPITYDIASLMRDAFLSWDEEFVLDISVRYWQRARRAGLMDFEDWHSDFGAFWQAIEWMGLQRHLKVAGIFARLTLRDGKPRYLADAPRFIAYIRHTAARYRELAPLLRLIDEVEGTASPSAWVMGRG